MNNQQNTEKIHVYIIMIKASQNFLSRKTFESKKKNFGTKNFETKIHYNIYFIKSQNNFLHSS